MKLNENQWKSTKIHERKDGRKEGRKEGKEEEQEEEGRRMKKTREKNSKGCKRDQRNANKKNYIYKLPIDRLSGCYW